MDRTGFSGERQLAAEKKVAQLNARIECIVLDNAKLQQALKDSELGALELKAFPSLTPNYGTLLPFRSSRATVNSLCQ